MGFTSQIQLVLCSGIALYDVKRLDNAARRCLWSTRLCTMLHASLRLNIRIKIRIGDNSQLIAGLGLDPLLHRQSGEIDGSAKLEDLGSFSSVTMAIIWKIVRNREVLCDFEIMFFVLWADVTGQLEMMLEQGQIKCCKCPHQGYMC